MAAQANEANTVTLSGGYLMSVVAIFIAVLIAQWFSLSPPLQNRPAKHVNLLGQFLLILLLNLRVPNHRHAHETQTHLDFPAL